MTDDERTKFCAGLTLEITGKIRAAGLQPEAMGMVASMIVASLANIPGLSIDMVLEAVRQSATILKGNYDDHR